MKSLLRAVLFCILLTPNAFAGYASSGSAAGGGGDITDVWGCTTGNCNAITGASGDSLNASSADSTISCKTGTTVPATCSVGMCFVDTDALPASQFNVCTATNTWTPSGLSRYMALSSTTFNTGSAQTLAISGISTPDADGTITQMRPSGTITFSNLRCAVTTAVPGAGKSWTINLQVGGANSVLQVSIADTTVVSSVDTDSVTVVGDGAATSRVYYVVTPASTPTASAIACSVDAVNS
jgi:hypothetical protein